MVAGGWLVWNADRDTSGGPQWPLVATLLVAAGCGTPIFVVLGGLAIVLFLTDGVGPSAILIETYQLAVKPTLASIPLFTLCGFLLAEGKAPERLLNVFRALFGWFPGGTAVVCAMLSAFFTIFTGGSGVTILALGGLLLPALIKDGYREKFSVGLLTASGSLGLLLPPSLPLILYAIVAQIPVEDLFIGGILPGVLLLALTAAWGVREGATSRRRGRTPFSPAGALRRIVGGQVGSGAAGRGAGRALRRVCDDRRSCRARGALRVHRPGRSSTATSGSSTRCGGSSRSVWPRSAACWSSSASPLASRAT